MAVDVYKIVGINPEPWAIGPVGTTVRQGKHVPYVGENANLVTYQRAVKDYIFEHYCPGPPLEGPCTLALHFWRRLDKFSTKSEKQHQRHIADATNLQKGLEDALQGLLFKNDRQIQSISSLIVEQGADVNPGIIIVLMDYVIPWADVDDWNQERAAADAVPDLGNSI